MAFYEDTRFPVRVSYGAQGGPMWETVIATTRSGREQRDGAWQYPKQKWGVSQGIKSGADFEEVRAHFLVHLGRLHAWRFRDWSDYQLTQSNSRLVEHASSPGEWKINRVYTFASREVLRPITKPISGLVVYRTRSGSTTTATSSVDTTTGIVSVSGHVAGDTYTCVGEFDVPMRYDTDEFPGRVIGRNQTRGLLFECLQLTIVEAPVVLV